MTGSIYFIRYGTTGWVKIGYATDVKKRLGALQVSSPEDLTLEATVAGTRQQEKELHHALPSLRGNGEWFQPSPTISLLIEMALAGSTISELIAFAKEPLPDEPKERVSRLQVIQWTRWANDESLPVFWRNRYREWLKDDHGIELPKLRGVVGQADELRAVA